MLKRKPFIDLLNGYMKEDELLRKIEKFVEEFNTSYTVLDSTPAQVAILRYLENEMELENEGSKDLITWYLYENVDKLIHTKYGDFVLKNINDLYDCLTIVYNVNDDIAYYIAQIIKDKYLSKFADKNFEKDMDIYMYICNNTADSINRFLGSTNYEELNMVICLKILKEAIEKDKK